MADSRANHAQHDLELVAAWATGEATGADLERAERLLDACDLCVGVARDIRAITLGLQEIPSVQAMTELPKAPRDFRLTPEQAARLRPAAPILRWSDRLLRAIVSFGRPVGASLAALGVVGLLVGAATLGSFGGAATLATNAPAAADSQASPAPGVPVGGAPGAQPEATNGAAGGTEYGAAATQSAPETNGVFGQSAEASPEPRTIAGASPAAPGLPAATWLLVVSAGALLGGIGLVVLATRRG